MQFDKIDVLWTNSTQMSKVFKETLQEYEKQVDAKADKQILLMVSFQGQGVESKNGLHAYFTSDREAKNMVYYPLTQTLVNLRDRFHKNLFVLGVFDCPRNDKRDKKLKFDDPVIAKTNHNSTGNSLFLFACETGVSEINGDLT